MKENRNGAPSTGFMLSTPNLICAFSGSLSVNLFGACSALNLTVAAFTINAPQGLSSTLLRSSLSVLPPLTATINLDSGSLSSGSPSLL